MHTDFSLSHYLLNKSATATSVTFTYNNYYIVSNQELIQSVGGYKQVR